MGPNSSVNSTFLTYHLQHSLSCKAAEICNRTNEFSTNALQKEICTFECSGKNSRSGVRTTAGTDNKAPFPGHRSQL